MDIQKTNTPFMTLDPESGKDSTWEAHGINLAQGRLEALLMSFTEAVGYAVHVLNDGSIVVHSARSGRTRYFTLQELIRTALVEGLDPAPMKTIDSSSGARGSH